MNWGHKIALTFTGFVAIIMYLVITSFNQDIDLVTDDYYAAELEFQKQIDKLENTAALSEKITAQITEEGLEIIYPENLDAGRLVGKVQLYRPSAASRDKLYDIKLDSNRKQLIKASELTPGKYKLKIDFSDGLRDYFQEIPVFVPGV